MIQQSHFWAYIWRKSQLESTHVPLVVQAVKNLPAVRGTLAWYLGWEDPLEKEMATHSSILTREIPWTEDPGGLQSMGTQTVRHNWGTNT